MKGAGDAAFHEGRGLPVELSACMELVIYPHVVYIMHEEAHVCVLPLVSHYFTDQQALITNAEEKTI